jgi:histidinol-phosphate/aromatic aminotransferase/cobyric acid decarboxylase-like protein
VGNGSTELIYLVARALRPGRGLIVTPAFSEYEHALNLARVPADFYPTEKPTIYLQRPELQAGTWPFWPIPPAPACCWTRSCS